MTTPFSPSPAASGLAFFGGGGLATSPLAFLGRPLPRLGCAALGCKSVFPCPKGDGFGGCRFITVWSDVHGLVPHSDGVLDYCQGRCGADFVHTVTPLQ